MLLCQRCWLLPQIFNAPDGHEEQLLILIIQFSVVRRTVHYQVDLIVARLLRLHPRKSACGG